MASYLCSSPEAESMIKRTLFIQHTRTIKMAMKRAMQHLPPVAPTASATTNAAKKAAAATETVTATTTTPTITIPTTTTTTLTTATSTAAIAKHDLAIEQDALRVAHYHIGLMAARMGVPCADSEVMFTNDGLLIVRLAREFRAVAARVAGCVAEKEEADYKETYSRAQQLERRAVQGYSKDTLEWTAFVISVMRKRQRQTTVDMAVDIDGEVAGELENEERTEGAAKDANANADADGEENVGRKPWRMVWWIAAVLFALVFGAAAAGLSLLALRGDGSTVRGGGVSNGAGVVAQSTGSPVSAPAHLNPGPDGTVDTLGGVEDGPQPSPPL